MWSAPDGSRLPSREERLHMKTAINELETELSDLQARLVNNERRNKDIQQQLARLESELKETEANDGRLRERITEIEKEAQTRRAWISPERKLPKEMLGEIFVFHVMQDWKAPLIDSSVCKRWRSAALSTPRLWSYLRLPDPSLPEELTSMWIKRAGTVPLHIHINYQDVTPTILESYRDAYCLKFKPWPTYLQGLSFSRLEKLMLDHDDASLEHLERGVFMSMPRLKCLHLHWFRLSRRPLLSWGWDLPPLEEFHFAGMTWAWIDAIDQLGSSLQRLALDIGEVATPPPSTIVIRPVNLPNLQYFAYGAQSRTLHMNDSERIPIVTQIIKAPNLESFEDHSVVLLETTLLLSQNWSFPKLKSYRGLTSRELADVKVLYPHLERIAFIVDSETGVLDVTALIEDATTGVLDSLKEMELFQGTDLAKHPMVEQSLRKYQEAMGKKLLLSFMPGADMTPYQEVTTS
jgi:hypothetical protein